MAPSVPLKELKHLVKDFISKIPRSKAGKKKMLEWADQTGLLQTNSAVVKASNKAAKDTDIMKPVVNLLPDDSKQAPPVKQKKGKVVSGGDIGTKKVSKNTYVKTAFLSDPARAGKTAIKVSPNLREHLEESRLVDVLEKEGRPIAGRSLKELRQLPKHISEEVKALTLKHGVSTQSEPHHYNAPQRHAEVSAKAETREAATESEKRETREAATESEKPVRREAATQGVSALAPYHEFLASVKGRGKTKAEIAELWKAHKAAAIEGEPKSKKKSKRKLPGDLE